MALTPTIFMGSTDEKLESDTSWLNSITTLQQAFNVICSPSLLLQHLNHYALKAAEVVGDYAIDSQALDDFTSAVTSKKHITVSELTSMQVIYAWPTRLNWVQFNQHIEQLQYAWLHDYQHGLNLDIAFILARSLRLHSNIDTQNTQLKFQCFLMHLLAGVTHQFDQHQYRYLQYFDIETQLPNHQLLINLLQEYTQRTQESALPPAPLGILMINLNIDFESTSHLGEHLGAISANISQTATQVVKKQLNSDSYLFRVSTQELAVVFTKLKYPAQLQLIAAKLAHAFEKELPLQDMTLILQPYFGGVSSLQQQVDVLSLLENAKLALHQAIINNVQIEIYDELVTGISLSQHQLDEAIVKALQQNELDIYIHPLVSLTHTQPNDVNNAKTEHCVSGELLLRWPNAKVGNISPVRLIESIYKKGFGKTFIRWLINTACRRCAEMREIHQRVFSLTINLSSIDLLDEDLPELLTQSIALWKVPAENIVIEITETDLTVNEEKVLKVLDEIVALGFKIALDDFGTGYSSMSRLRSMPVHLVKIDQSFVRHLVKSNKDKAIVQSILNLSHSLGKEVVAEGVEDLACLNMLREMQCDKIQGYYYAKPMPFEDFMPWLTQFETARGG